MVIYPINDLWAKNHPHKLILIKQIVNHPITYRIEYDFIEKSFILQMIS
jgi:hypothetical protein